MRQDVGTGSDELRIMQLGWMLFFKIFSDKDEEIKLLNENYKSPIPKELRWSKWAGNDEGITGDELLNFVDQKLFPSLGNIDLSTADQRALILHEVFANNYNYMKSGIHLRQVINKLNEIDFNQSKDLGVFGQIYETFLSELQSAGTLGEFYTPRPITQFMTEMISPKVDELILDPACGTGGFLTSVIDFLKSNMTKVSEHKKIQKNILGWEYKPLPFMLANTNLILHDVLTPNIKYGDALQKSLNEYTQKDKVDIILANPPFGGVVSNNNENNFPKNFRTKESADLFLILILKLLKNGGRAAIVLPDGSLTGDGVKIRIREELLSNCNLHTIIRLPNSVFKPYAQVATNILFFKKGEKTKDIWYYQHNLPKDYKSYSKTRPIQIEEFNKIKDWWNNRKANSNSWKVNIDKIVSNNFDLDIKNPNRPKEEQKLTLNEMYDFMEKSFLETKKLMNEFKSKFEE
tara:strand:- start:6 stop:1391 length:1386 start_codon:yes stop_codon:yes gene_type:complete